MDSENTPWVSEYSDDGNRWWEIEPETPSPASIAAQRAGITAISESGKPIIKLHTADIAELTTTIEHLLVKHGVPFYSKSGAIVQPVIDYGKSLDGTTVPIPKTKSVSPMGLLDYMSRTLTFQKYDGRAKSWVDTMPPMLVASVILSRDGEWQFPIMSGLITTPTIRPDGSIIWRAGYDPDTQLYLSSPPSLPSIPEHPTRDDALRAIRLLDGLLTEFPFVDTASRSVALSGLITPVCRGAIPVAPMHIMSATQAGSGKSFLVDLCSAIVSGTKAPAMSFGGSVEEFDKRLGASLMESEPIITIDNINGSLYSDLLCQAIERPMVTTRILGASKMIKIQSSSTIFATGNQISVRDDMNRRSLMCHLDPDTERPESRQFHDDPYERIIAHRGEYIAAALTIVRAYILADRPGRLPRLASFGGWSDTVRSAIVWLGYDDPVKSMERTRSGDSRLQTARSLIAAWSDIIGTGENTALYSKDIYDKSLQDGGADLNIAIQEFCPQKSSTFNLVSFGTKISKLEGRVIDGFKIKSTPDKHTRRNRWYLEPHKTNVPKYDISDPDLIEF